VIDRLPQLAGKGDYLKQEMKRRLIEHRRYITRHGEDMPLVREWRWQSEWPATRADKQ